MKDYIVRFVQMHESFRLPELQAAAELAGVQLEVVDYRNDSPFCIIRLPSDDAARAVISRSILGMSIASLWGSAPDYPTLHANLQANSSHLWPQYHQSSFYFDIDCFRGKRASGTRSDLINSFAYMDLAGPILPSDPNVDLILTIHEEYRLRGTGEPAAPPQRVFLSQHIAHSARPAVATYDLKKRHYISTTSMDAELALITANMARLRPGCTAYDPFCGTGSFLVAAAHWGAHVLGSDLDGRVVRGNIKDSRGTPVKAFKIAQAAAAGKGEGERSVRGNLAQYGLQERWMDGFVSDLTNSPVRGRWLDAVVCDPPYGVREGLKVLGSHRPDLQEVVLLKDGRQAHLTEGYIPPKRPYSFSAMLADILSFSADTLVDNGRLCIWIPAENVDEGAELGIPTHPALTIVSVSTQEFARWSRRLVVYARLADAHVNRAALDEYNALRQTSLERGTADQLNDFRRRFFEGFKPLPA